MKTRISRLGVGQLLAWALVLVAHRHCCALTGAEVVGATGISQGLCVVVGSTDGGLEAELAAAGKMLVHGLSTDAARVQSARAQIRGQSLYGLASVEKAASYALLPYATELVNLVVADIDALGAGAPSDAEIMRVLVPGGTAYLKKGSWTKTVKPWPAQHDDWTHYDHGPTRNPVSKDAAVAPTNSIKWVDSYQNEPDHTAGLGYGPRIYRGSYLHRSRIAHRMPDRSVYNRSTLDCRDPFNGLMRWSVKGDMGTNGPLVTGGSEIYTFLEAGSSIWRSILPAYGEPLGAFDIATGARLRDYPAAGLADENSRTMDVVLHQGTLYVGNRDTLYAIDAATGTRKWFYTENDSLLMVYPAVSADGTRLFAAACRGNYLTAGTNDPAGTTRWANNLGGRWPALRCAAVVCLSPANGSVTWRSTEFVGKGGGELDMPGIANIIPCGEYLVMFGSCGIIAQQDDPFLGALRISDGKLLWIDSYQEGGYRSRYKGTDFRPSYWARGDAGSSYWPFAGFACMVKDGRAYAANNGSARGYSLATGALEIKAEPSTVNQRCVRPSATEKYLLIGFGEFIDKDGNFTFSNIARGGCATPTIPAVGMTFITPNGCGCMAQIRGYTGLAREPWPVAPVDDAARIETGPGIGKAPATTGSPAIASVRFEPLEGFRKALAACGTDGPAVAFRTAIETGSPIRDAWYNNNSLPYPESETVTSGGVDYVAVVNEHRLEARTGATVKWSFTADARISRAPVVTGGRVVFGAHDGYVYCLRESDGALQWRFFAAPDRRKMVAYGQLESTWPVFGVTEFEGKICFSSGRHPELNGGLYLFGVEPATGQAAWKGTIAYQTEWRTPGSKTESGRKNSVVNQAMQVVDGTLRLGGLVIDPAGPPKDVVDTRTLRLAERGIVGLFADRFVLPGEMSVELTLSDMRGRTVAVLYHGTGHEGVTLFGSVQRLVAPGRYILRFDAGANRLERPIVRL